MGATKELAKRFRMNHSEAKGTLLRGIAAASDLPREDFDLSQWFTDEVKPHEPALRAHLRGSFPQVRDVDDIVQEAFLRIFRAKAIRRIESTRAFLFRIARNLAIDGVRREKMSSIDLATNIEDVSTPEDGPDAAEYACTSHEITLLTEAIDMLPPRCREIVILRRLRAVPQKEIALRMGISEQTVQVQASRGLKRCEKFLRQRGALESRK
jgi:RNA polymerase sigma-70 factor (ECF subfamily)